MNIVLPVSLYLSLLFATMQNWLLLAGVLIIVFSLRYKAASLIPLAILIDGYFGNFYTIPFLSLASVVWFMFIEYMHPKIISFRAT